MSKKDEISEPPGLEDIRELFPPSAPASPSPVTNISMKLPTFWPGAAELWLTQADTQFGIRNITFSKTKFNQAVAVLPQEVASQILDLIPAPPAGDPYQVLREGLITLNTQKPSHLMNRMLALLPDHYKPDFILRGLFLRRLPIDVQSQLFSEKVSDP